MRLFVRNLLACVIPTGLVLARLAGGANAQAGGANAQSAIVGWGIHVFDSR